MTTYQQSPEALDVTQGKGDVHKHNDIANNYSADVTVALPVYFIFNTPLGTKGYSQVGVFIVLHKPDKSEMGPDKHKHTISTCVVKTQSSLW